MKNSYLGTGPIRRREKILDRMKKDQCAMCGHSPCTCKRFRKMHRKEIPQVLASRKGKKNTRTIERQITRFLVLAYHGDIAYLI